MKTRKVAVSVPTQVRIGKAGDVYFVTIYPNGELEIRPKGSRKPESTVTVTTHSVYQNALLRRAKAAKPARKRPTTRGLLSLERRSDY